MSSDNTDPDFKISVYAELKPLLGTAQVFLKIYRQSKRRQISLIISRHYIEVRWSKRNVHVLHFPGVRLVPTTCHSMQWLEHNQLHFRVQVNNGLSLPTQLTCFSDESTIENLDVYRGQDVTMCCALCTHVILYKQKFRRVLPLPSDNWHDMSDSVFCCAGHSKDLNPETPTQKQGDCSDRTEERIQQKSELSLHPRDGDCLVGETHFLFHSNSLNEKNIRIHKISGMVTCSRCSSVIGQNLCSTKSEPLNGCVETEKKGNTVKLYRVCVLVPGSQLSDGPLSRRDTLELEISSLLLSLSQRYNSFRFVLESREPHTATPHIMLWLLDSRCEQLIGGTDSDVKEKEVMSQPVLKVLYLDCLREKHASISAAWGKDLLVHSVDLPTSVCLQVLSLLTDSTQVLPKSTRVQHMEGTPFYMGFLKKKKTPVSVECKGRGD